MKKVLLIASIVFVINPVFCQEKKRATNTVYLELGGNAFIYSMNYNRVFFSERSIHVGLSVGGSYLPSFDDGATVMTPIEINLLLGRKNNFLEFGFGQTIILSNHNDFGSPTISLVRLGYRFQRKKNGVMLRVAALPFFSERESGIWFGLSLGHSF